MFSALLILASLTDSALYLRNYPREWLPELASQFISTRAIESAYRDYECELALYQYLSEKYGLGNFKALMRTWHRREEAERWERVRNRSLGADTRLYYLGLSMESR